MTSALLHSDKLLYLDICVFSDLRHDLHVYYYYILNWRIKCTMESFIYIVRCMGNNNIPPVPLVKIMSSPKLCAVRRNGEVVSVVPV